MAHGKFQEWKFHEAKAALVEDRTESVVDDTYTSTEGDISGISAQASRLRIRYNNGIVV